MTSQELKQWARHRSFRTYSAWGAIIALAIVGLMLPVRYWINYAETRSRYESQMESYQKESRRYFEEVLAGKRPVDSITDPELREATRSLQQIPLDKNEDVAVVQTKAWLYDVLVKQQVPPTLKPYLVCDRYGICALKEELRALDDSVRFVRIRAGDERAMTPVSDPESLTSPVKPERPTTPFLRISFANAAIGYGAYVLVFALVFYLAGWKLEDGLIGDRDAVRYTSPKKAWPASLFGLALMLTALPGLVLMRIVSADVRGFFAWLQSKFDGAKKPVSPYDDLLQRLEDIRSDGTTSYDAQERARVLTNKLQTIKMLHEQEPVDGQLAEIAEFVGLEGDRAKEIDQQLKNT